MRFAPAWPRIGTQTIRCCTWCGLRGNMPARGENFMQDNKHRFRALGLATTVLLCSATPALAQTTPSGQVGAPGTQGRRSGVTNCVNTESPASGTTAATTSNANDSNCVEAAPGFVSPSLPVTGADSARAVTAFVRVDSVVPRPPVTLPAGDSFSVVGGATLVKVRRAELKDCIATGKRISARANASTSTTCLDRKGELLAYEECKLGAADCVVVTTDDVARQQDSAKPAGSAKSQ